MRNRQAKKGQPIRTDIYEKITDRIVADLDAARESVEKFGFHAPG
jgi:antirestriction protein ArdC